MQRFQGIRPTGDTCAMKWLGIWHAHRQTTTDAAESFGVLIGTTSVDRQEIWIEAGSRRPWPTIGAPGLPSRLGTRGHQAGMVYSKFTWFGR